MSPKTGCVWRELIEVHGGHATVHGVEKLKGVAPFMATDLRPALSLILLVLAQAWNDCEPRLYLRSLGYEHVGG